MSTSQELVSVLRERFFQSEERVDFQKTFMNYARDQTCREAKMTVMTLRQVLGVYLDIRPNDSKYKLIPDVVNLIGLTDRNMKVDCQQVMDHVFGKHLTSNSNNNNSCYGNTLEVTCNDSRLSNDRGKRPGIAFWSRSANSSAKRDSAKSSGHCSVMSPSKNSYNAISSHDLNNPTGRQSLTNRSSGGSLNKRNTFTKEGIINSTASAPTKSSGNNSGVNASAVDDLQRQYRMAVIDLQVAEYDNKLYRNTLDQLKKQLESEKMKHEELKTKFEIRKRKFRNVKLKFRNNSEVLLREIVSMTHKCNEAFNQNMDENKSPTRNSKKPLFRKIANSRQKETTTSQESDGNATEKKKQGKTLIIGDVKCDSDIETAGAGMGDSLIKPVLIPLSDR